MRELKDRDFPLLVEMLTDPVVMRWLFGIGPMLSGEAERFIGENFVFGRSASGRGVLRTREADMFVGFAGLLPCRYLNEDDFELGFALKENAWGRGYATEIGAAQIVYGFEAFDVKRLLGLAHPQNTASLHALEKIGMRLLKTISTDQRGPRCVYMIEKNM